MLATFFEAIVAVVDDEAVEDWTRSVCEETEEDSEEVVANSDEVDSVDSLEVEVGDKTVDDTDVEDDVLELLDVNAVGCEELFLVSLEWDDDDDGVVVEDFLDDDDDDDDVVVVDFLDDEEEEDFSDDEEDDEEDFSDEVDVDFLEEDDEESSESSPVSKPVLPRSFIQVCLSETIMFSCKYPLPS